jgi:hypothetical protein
MCHLSGRNVPFAVSSSSQSETRWTVEEMKNRELFDAVLRSTPWNEFVNGESIADKLADLLGAVSEEEAEEAYWGLDNVAVVQGRMYPVAVEIIPLVGLALQCAPSPAATFRFVELLTEFALGVGHEVLESPDVLVQRVRSELKSLYGLLFGLLGSPDPRIRRDVLDILAIFEDERIHLKRAVEFLANDPDDAVRATAAQLTN